MAFVVKKKIAGKEYYYLNKSERKGNKVVSKYVAYLGKDKKGADEKARKILGLSSSEKTQDNKSLARKDISIDELAVFCKRKGFVYPSGEIYGGLAGF
ncbi:MAG: hypothetical protein AABW50_01975, partial [Nanoarchaeota archaeon]